MNTLQVELGNRSYPIYIGSGLLDHCDLYARHIKAKQVLVVTNEKVALLYLDKVLAQLKAYNATQVILPDGEQHKSLDVLNQIFDTLLLNKSHFRINGVGIDTGFSLQPLPAYQEFWHSWRTFNAGTRRY